MNNDFLEIFNKISKMSGDNLVEKILDYCETYDKNPQEVGDFLEDNKEFKKLLYDECVNNNIIKDPKYKESLNRTEHIEEW